MQQLATQLGKGAMHSRPGARILGEGVFRSNGKRNSFVLLKLFFICLKKIGQLQALSLFANKLLMIAHVIVRFVYVQICGG